MTRLSSSIRIFLASLCLTAASLTTGATQAQTAAYPIKTVHAIVPFPAGGLVDGVARTLMHEIAQSIGQTVVVENRSGAGGSIGAAAVAQSPADGYKIGRASCRERGDNSV